MTDIPLVDLSPIGDQDSFGTCSSNLSSVAADVPPSSKTSRTSFEQALHSWEGGPRRALFQHAATGIQAELLTLITAVSSAGGVINLRSRQRCPSQGSARRDRTG